VYQYQGLDDTIAAISTAAGPGGIGMVRLSGPDSTRTAAPNFLAQSKQPLESFASHTVHYGWIKDGDSVVDEVLVTVMRAPRTYTRQDVVEVTCHGGAAAAAAILGLMLRNGARLAEPGEFTKRAFLNGRVDLAQAEAVLDIIKSGTRSFLKASAQQLRGELSIELEKLRGRLMDVYTEMEAVINFPEDDTGSRGEARLLDILRQSLDGLRALLETADQGRMLKEGVRMVICGKPNVGKSSLLNLLLRAPRAIVSGVAGTTRDTIEEPAQIGGVPFLLVDTAGIIEPRDLIEREAVRRSRDCIASADLVMFVLDGSRPFEPEDGDLLAQIRGQNAVVVVNKNDLEQKLDPGLARGVFGEKRVVSISALKAADLDVLRETILDCVLPSKSLERHGPLLSNLRHIEALRRCEEAVAGVVELLPQGAAREVLSGEIKRAVNELDRLTGRDIDADLIDRIFSEFCVGK
jgi:tRNA modification GTPase